MLKPSTVRNTLLHLFQGISFLNLWRWLLFLSSLASCFDDIMHRQIDGVAVGSTMDQPLPIFLLAAMNLNFSRAFSSHKCITAIWMTFSYYLATKMRANFSDTSASTRSLFFALLLKKNRTWLSFSWTCWLKNPFSSSLFLSIGNSNPSVNIYVETPSVHRNA